MDNLSSFAAEEQPLINERGEYEVAAPPPLRQDEMVHFFHSPKCIQGSTACLQRILETAESAQAHKWALYPQERCFVAKALSEASRFLRMIWRDILCFKSGVSQGEGLPA
jgi:hypothetical protein